MKTMIRKNVSKKELGKLLKLVKDWEMVLVNQQKGGGYNIVASEKMYDETFKGMYERVSDFDPSKKKSKGDIMKEVSEMNATQIVKAAYNEETSTEAVKEVKRRVKVAQKVYSMYNPDDKFVKRGDPADMEVASLISAWDNEKLEKKATKTITEWLSMYDKVGKSV